MPIRVLVLWWVIVAPVNALPILEFQFLNSGQTYSPLDTVPMAGRLTNIGDMPLVGGVGQGSMAIGPGSLINQQYIADFPPGLAPFPPGVLSLAPGEFIDWTLALWTPFPITGALGDPVLTGDYIYSLALLTTSVFVPAGAASVTYDVRQSQAQDFTWRVVDSSSTVPASAPLSLLCISLLCWQCARNLGGRRPVSGGFRR